MPDKQTYDAVVAGAGPAGLAAACLLANSRCKTVCIAPGLNTPSTAPAQITRTVALMRPAMRMLETLVVWPGDLKQHCAPLIRLKIVDDTLATFSAPPVMFASEEIGEAEFGWNIPLDLLVTALKEAAQKAGVTLVDGEVQSYQQQNGIAEITLKDGTMHKARTVIAADGSQSVLRHDAHIATTQWQYDQTALALSFTHSASHNNMSVEYHKSSGPFTTVPLPGNSSSLVWLVNPNDTDGILSLSEDELAMRLQLEMHGDLGLISDVTKPAIIPMRGLTAKKFARNRVFLVGEAAHVVPPIGAQGLNMSLRDAAYATDLISDAIRLDEDPGSESICQRYDDHRRADIIPRQAAIDTMNRSLTSAFFPLHLGRAISMTALQNIPPLKKRAMLQGISPSDRLPRAMRA